MARTIASSPAQVATLAIDGGAPSRTRPFAPWPVFEEDERRASDAVLASGKVNYWTGGECAAFEKEYASRIGVAHAISLANGTVALELALRALGVGPGDEVVAPAKTFIATASCAVAVGARPVVCDVDPESQNLTAESVRAVLTPRTKAVVAVHLAGWPCDMAPLVQLCQEHGIALVEDCAQAHGAVYRGAPVGSLGRVSAFSFCQDKIMTTGGEGGMVTTNDDELWSRMWSFKDHGKSWDAVNSCQSSLGFRWVHESFGTNWRMLEIQAAIGRIQLRRMREWTTARQENADVIGAALAALTSGDGPLRVPRLPAKQSAASEYASRHAHYKFYIYVDPERLPLGWSRDRIISEIKKRGVPCYQGSCPEVYLEKAFDGTPWRPRQRLPVARDLGDSSLMFLVHPTLTGEEVRRTAEVAAEVIRSATS
jgi:dTDP-4-amino-4,6-dideoxygalactose transaminase